MPFEIGVLRFALFVSRLEQYRVTTRRVGQFEEEDKLRTRNISQRQQAVS